MSEYGLFDDGSAVDPGYVPPSAFRYDADGDDAALGAAMRAASSGAVTFGATSSGGTFGQAVTGAIGLASSGLRTLSETIRSFNATRTDIARSNAQASIDQINLNAATDAARRRAQSLSLQSTMPLGTQLMSMVPMIAVLGVVAYGVSKWRK